MGSIISIELTQNINDMILGCVFKSDSAVSITPDSGQIDLGQVEFGAINSRSCASYEPSTGASMQHGYDFGEVEDYDVTAVSIRGTGGAGRAFFIAMEKMENWYKELKRGRLSQEELLRRRNDWRKALRPFGPRIIQIKRIASPGWVA